MNDRVRVALPGGDGFDARRDENLLAAAQRAHWLIRFGCRNGNCEACAATLQRGCVTQRGVRIDAANGPQPILLCLATAHTDLLIDVPGDPLHGSAAHARRCYAQLHAIARDGMRWRLTFTLPAGKPLPVYAGQFVRIENAGVEMPALDATIEEGALNGRALTVFCDTPPVIDPGARVHLTYPLGYAYRIATQPLWLLHDAASASRARSLHAALADSVCIEMDAGEPSLPPANAGIVVLAYAAAETSVDRWYQQLLAARVPFAELRSDFAIWRPWRVCRQDGNDNRFVMADFQREAEARALADAFAARGHKQLYWAEPMPFPNKETDKENNA